MEVFIVCLIFFASVFLWIYIIRKSKNTTNDDTITNYKKQENEQKCIEQQEQEKQEDERLRENENFINSILVAFRAQEYNVKRCDDNASAGIDMILWKNYEKICVRCIPPIRKAEPRDVRLLRSVAENKDYNRGIIVSEYEFDNSTWQEKLNEGVAIQLMTRKELCEKT